MKTLKSLLSVVLLIVAMTVVTSAPASAHSGGSNNTYYYPSCQVDHFVAFNWAGGNNSDSYAYNTNCWSTYSRVYFNGTAYVEASGNPVDSLASWPNHQYVGAHLACFGLYNCNSIWFGDHF